VPFVVQIGFYVSPVGYPSSLVAERYEQYRMLFSLNPMVGIIDGFRWSILGGGHVLYWPAEALTVGWVVLLVGSGIWFFRRTERTFADVI
jgi:lipopolysaccharide transport system permease protein